MLLITKKHSASNMMLLITASVIALDAGIPKSCSNFTCNIVQIPNHEKNNTKKIRFDFSFTRFLLANGRVLIGELMKALLQ